MVSSLFQLPGELRNNIYEFSLSEVEGLYYRNDDRGVGWLCLATVRGNYELKTSTTEAQDVNDQVKHRCNICKRKIYHDDGLPKEVDSTDMVKIGKGYIVANQLQFVSQQLRHETKALGIRYNKITFLCSDLRVITTFLQRLPSTQEHHLRQIIIKPETRFWIASFFAMLTEICKKLPHLVIRYHFPTFCLHRNPNQLIKATIHSIAVRGFKEVAERFTGNTFLQQKIIQQAKTVETQSQIKTIAPNIRLLPHHGILDLVAFKEACEEDVRSTNWVLGPERCVDTLIQLAQDWSEHGL
jgi:hypothetical protein